MMFINWLSLFEAEDCCPGPCCDKGCCQKH
jgi:hypothetical protein